MFLRKLKNRSGSTSIQIISKARGKYKVVKTIGYGTSEQEIVTLLNKGRQEIEKLSQQPKLFVSQEDILLNKPFHYLKIQV